MLGQGKAWKGQSDFYKTDIQASSVHTKDRLLHTFLTLQPSLSLSKHLWNIGFKNIIKKLKYSQDKTIKSLKT